MISRITVVVIKAHPSRRRPHVWTQCIIYVSYVMAQRVRKDEYSKRCFGIELKNLKKKTIVTNGTKRRSSDSGGSREESTKASWTTSIFEFCDFRSSVYYSTASAITVFSSTLCVWFASKNCFKIFYFVGLVRSENLSNVPNRWSNKYI